MGSLRQYVCNLWKELQIGSKIKFENGFFETDDRKLQQQIESRDSFGSAIQFVDSLEEMEKVGREREQQEVSDRARIKAKIAEEERQHEAKVKHEARLAKEKAAAQKDAEEKAENAIQAEKDAEEERRIEEELEKERLEAVQLKTEKERKRLAAVEKKIQDEKRKADEKAQRGAAAG